MDKFYYVLGSNMCGRPDKNGCSHLCLPTDRLQGRCACPSNGGLALYDNKQCSGIIKQQETGCN